MNAADLIIGILQKEGVEYPLAFPHPGLIDAAARSQFECITSEKKRFARRLPAEI